MRRQTKERRMKFTDIYCRTWSLKAAIEITSKRFNVSEATLRTDWSRRGKWLKEVSEYLSDPNLMSIGDMGIRRTLQQIEVFIAETSNDNCKLGALKHKTKILFKLKEAQRSKAAEEFLKKEILERLENLERKIEQKFGHKNGIER